MDPVEGTSRSRRNGILMRALTAASSSDKLKLVRNRRLQVVLIGISARYEAPRLALMMTDSSMKQQIASQL
jgi:hypothetical protein